MKWLTIVSSIAAICLSPVASAFQDYQLTIKNHFTSPLSFIVGINPNVLPDLPQNFTLDNNKSIRTKVLNIGKKSYIRVIDDKKNNAFWSVGIENNKVKVHGYIGSGIAYSWKEGNVVTFCTPEDYKKKLSC